MDRVIRDGGFVPVFRCGQHHFLLLSLAFILPLSVQIVNVTGTLNPFHSPCIPRDLGKGSIVCVCNSTHCDSQSIPPPTDQGSGRDEIHIFTSDKTGQRLHKSSVQFQRIYQGGGPAAAAAAAGEDTTTTTDFWLEEQQDNRLDESYRNELRDTRAPRLGPSTLADTLNVLMSYPLRNRISRFVVQRSVKYQRIMGFGGAFTDAAGINIAALSQSAQENLIKAYFGPTGIDYSIGRVPIGGTDFSTRPYTYDDRGKEPDVNLTYFALQPEDYKYKLPYIKLAETYRGEPLKLVASPWSAPVWMKTNNKLNGAGVLRREFYQAWADYIARFLHEYQKEGVKIWAITTGNEPFNGFIRGFPFNCMGWRAADMRDWIVNNLGPTLKGKTPSEESVRIIIFDDNKGGLPTWTKKIIQNNASAAYVDGVGTHWYFDFLTGTDALSRFHKKHPEYFIMQTEACLGFTPWELEKVIPGSWERGEKYLEAIIRDMKGYVSGWLDWNLAVDLAGGPNWAKFAADAAILVNAEADEFLKQPIYYAIGHVSKFVPPGSVRIQMRGVQVPHNLQSVAFLRPDNRTVIIFLNKLAYDAKVSLLDEERGSLFLRVPARSMQTLIYNS